MGIIKYFFIALLLVVIGGGIYLTQVRPDLIPPALAKYTPEINSKTEQLQGQITNLKDNRIAPLGKSIDKSQVFAVDESNSQPLHQNAVEFLQLTTS